MHTRLIGGTLVRGNRDGDRNLEETSNHDAILTAVQREGRKKGHRLK